jgi:hypothetical protein
MTAQSGPRLHRAAPLVAYIIPLLFALHGCESEEDKRLASAREMVRRQQAAQAAPANPQPSNTAGSPVLPGNSTASPGSTAPAANAGLPIYPGARKISTGSVDNLGLDDGLTMEMLETRDPVDAVISFYSQRMIPVDARLRPTRTEDRLDGNRVVRLSLPRPDGGLQTVEAREEPGKTTIQLLNMKGKSSREVPASIPGLGPLPPASPGSGTSSRRGHTGVPPDLASPPPIDIPSQSGPSGR